MVVFTVITKVPKVGEEYGEGNLADGILVVDMSTKTLYAPCHFTDDFLKKLTSPTDKGIVTFKNEVFVAGEILLLNGTGREFSGQGRTPEKWAVETEEFDNIDDAIKRAVEVKNW